MILQYDNEWVTTSIDLNSMTSSSQSIDDSILFRWFPILYSTKQTSTTIFSSCRHFAHIYSIRIIHSNENWFTSLHRCFATEFCFSIFASFLPEYFGTEIYITAYHAQHCIFLAMKICLFQYHLLFGWQPLLDDNCTRINCIANIFYRREKKFFVLFMFQNRQH